MTHCNTPMEPEELNPNKYCCGQKMELCLTGEMTLGAWWCLKCNRSVKAINRERQIKPSIK